MRKPTDDEVQKNKVWQLVRAPGVWLATMAGIVATSVAAWGGQSLGVLGLSGVLAILVGLGTASWRWFRRGRELERLAHDAVLERIQRLELDKLKELRHKMRQDRDPRSTSLARQLRSILLRLTDAAVFERKSAVDQQYEAARTQAAELYESCLHLLERSLRMWEGARRMSTPEKQSELFEQRRELLEQVAQSMQHLDASLDQIDAAHLRDADGVEADHQRLRDELSMGLDVARRVEDRMTTLEHDLRVSE